MPPDVIRGAADIVRRFIEDYHERLEEDFLFPRFERAGRLVGLVETLRVQHRAGRRLTDEIERAATGTRLKDANSRRRLSASLRAFVAMYRPHAAREDTVLFPAFHKLVSRGEYDALGEQFEDEERRRFGQDGFESVLEEVARLERTLGIDDLRRFTPA